MSLRELGALFLMLLTACSGTPRVVHAELDPEERGLATSRYEVRVLAADVGQPEAVEVPRQDFQRAMRVLALGLPLSSEPRELGRWLMEGELHADLQAEVERGRVVRLMPAEEGSPLEAASAAELTRSYFLTRSSLGRGRTWSCTAAAWRKSSSG